MSWVILRCFIFEITDLVDFLLSRGAHPDVQDKGGHTPVMLAAELGSIDIVTRLSHSQANMRIVDSAGKGRPQLLRCLCVEKHVDF